MAKLLPIRIIVNGLGSVRQELKIADQIIEDWNRLHGERFGVVVRSWYWSDFPLLNVGKKPWEITTKLMIVKAHLFVTIVRLRPEAATADADPGPAKAARRTIGQGEYSIAFTSDLVLEADNVAEEQDPRVKVRESFLKNTSRAKFLLRSRFKRMFAVDLARALHTIVQRKP